MCRGLRRRAGKHGFPGLLQSNRSGAERHPKGRSEAKEARSALTLRGTKVIGRWAVVRRW